jgi:hypothetical protein
MHAIYATSLFRFHKQNKLKVFSTSIFDIDNTLKLVKLDLSTLILPNYHTYFYLFKKLKANILPPRRDYDYQISLKDRFNRLIRLCYNISYFELQALPTYLNQNISKLFLYTSLLTASCSLLFVKMFDRLL